MPARLLRAVAGATLLLGLAACGADPAPGATNADGDALVVYSGRNENLVKPLLERFTADTGIAVTARYDNSAALAAALLEEGDATRAEVFLSQEAGALGALQDAGRLAALPEAQLDRVDERYRSAEGRWVGVSGRSRVLVYNTDRVQEADLPQSVFELTEPAYAGQVAIAPTNASFQSFVTGMRVAAGEDRTEQFLRGLVANDVQADYEGNAQVLDAVDSGQISYGLINHYYLYEKADSTAGGLAALNSANHLFRAGDPGALVNVAGVGVLEGAADERTARLVDYLLAEPAQAYFAEQTHEFPLIKGVSAAAPGLPPLAGLRGPDVDLSELDTLEQTLTLLGKVGLT